MSVKDSPLYGTYVKMINERESIKLKKAAGEPKPWTTDPILIKYRFCNMRRMDDKVSLWLLNNWYEPYRDHPNMLYAALVGRFFNLPASLEEITGLVFSDGDWKYDEICKTLRARKASKKTIFNNAYMVRGNDGPDKVSTVMEYTIQPMISDPPEINTSSMQESWQNLVECYGMASFMTGQVVADLRWAMSGTWDDKDTWAPYGPGSSKGLCRLHDRPLKRDMNQDQFIEEVSELKEYASKEICPVLNSRMEMMDWQNTLCEFDKYVRVMNGEGRPKQLYPGAC